MNPILDLYDLGKGDEVVITSVTNSKEDVQLQTILNNNNSDNKCIVEQNNEQSCFKNKYININYYIIII